LSQVKDGGPAFPIPWGCDTRGMHLPAEPRGMSLRDYFAAAALTGILAYGRPVKVNGRDLATDEAAYAIADGMLLRREKGGDPC
jgi:hypothetical protein